MHTFGVSGKLIMNALVMYDHQTDTLWSQFLGEGVEGPLAGKTLDLTPLIHTTWEVWKAAHPETLVLDKRGRYQSDRYEGYYSSSEPGVIGERIEDDRLHTKALVVGVNLGGISKGLSDWNPGQAGRGQRRSRRRGRSRRFRSKFKYGRHVRVPCGRSELNL